jgi:hypothetical protein
MLIGTRSYRDIDHRRHPGELMADRPQRVWQTLLKLIVGFLTPEIGAVRIAGREVADVPPRA